MAGGPELDLGDIDRLDSRFKRRVATGIILVTLLSSVVAYLAADAGAREDQSAREAQRSAVTAMADDAGMLVDYYGAVAGYAEVQPFEQRRWVDELRAVLVPDRYAGRPAQWREAGQSLGDLSPLLDPRGYLGDAERYLGDLYYQVNLASLRQSVQRQTADAWGVKSERYTAILTVLAIVLSILGLSATFGQRMWRPLVRPAIAVAVACLVLGAAVARPRVPEIGDDVLHQVAEGDRLLTQGRFEGDRLLAQGKFEGAIQAYSRAIDQQPGYASAYVKRAGAYALAGSPDKGQSYVLTISDPRARAHSIADLERAMRLGADNDLLAVSDLGASYFFERRYGLAEKLARDAIRLNGDLTAAHLNLGLAPAGQGRADEAARAFGRAARLITQRPDSTERQELFAGGHTALEQLAGQSPERADLARRLQAQLTAAETARQLGPLGQLPPDASISGLAASVKDGSLTARYHHRAVPEGSALTWIVYTRPNPRAPWRAQPGLNLFQRFRSASAGRTDLPAGPCPAPGDYRVDLYLEGVYVASSQTTLPPLSDRLVGYGDPVSSFDMCLPPRWKHTGQPGMLEARSKEGQAISVSVLPAPPELARAGPAQLTVALDRLAAHKGFPLAAGPPRNRTVGDVAGLLRSYRRPGSIDRRFAAWVSLQPAAVLHVVVFEGYFDDDRLLRRLLASIRFA
jgi:tetratricopeptide (TPR) repeat protein